VRPTVLDNLSQWRAAVRPLVLVQMIFSIASSAAALAGGIALFAAPLTRAGRDGPRWVRIALWISGPATLGYGLLGFALLIGPGSLSENTSDLFVHFKTLVAGMALGILVLLIASGEFGGFFRRDALKGE